MPRTAKNMTAPHENLFEILITIVDKGNVLNTIKTIIVQIKYVLHDMSSMHSYVRFSLSCMNDDDQIRIVYQNPNSL